MLDILIVGGGLAGLANAIHLSKAGLKVKLLEKNDFPKHKVCGEYISNEILPYLEYLGVDPFRLGAVPIKRFLLSTTSGKTAKARLPLGGFGISRFTLDHFLYQKALENGCEIEKSTVNGVEYLNDYFKITTKSGRTYFAKFVIGAYGKRSNLDVRLDRRFIQKKAPFLAVKSHYRGEFPNDLVALHNFEGGYCGLSKVENDLLNICYLADYKTFKKYRNIEAYQQEVVYKNPYLKEIFEIATPVFDKPLTISQISFLPKKTVENHILMSGDSAGMIHPLCGNGMGMAVHSALLLSELLIAFFNYKEDGRDQLEREYAKRWRRTFRKRLMAGRLFNALFYQERLFRATISGLTFAPKVLPFFIRQTHGKEGSVEKDLALAVKK